MTPHTLAVLVNKVSKLAPDDVGIHLAHIAALEVLAHLVRVRVRVRVRIRVRARDRVRVSIGLGLTG